MALIHCQNITTGYSNNQIVSQNLSFQVNQGDYLWIIGENGTGKSTLMKTILGFINPIQGNVEFGDGLKQNEIGYLPQQTIAQKDFPASVEEVVLSGCLNRCGLRPFYNKEEKELAKQNMEAVGIYNLAKRCYRELSGGQQQRVLLARALCATKRILLLDEPVAALDSQATESLYQLIQQLRKSDITIIMVSHDLPKINQEATHVLYFQDESAHFLTIEDYLSRGGQ